jgi:hypothetical protein
MSKHSQCKPCGICTCPSWRETFPTEVGSGGECLTCDGSGLYHYCGDKNYNGYFERGIMQDETPTNKC